MVSVPCSPFVSVVWLQQHKARHIRCDATFCKNMSNEPDGRIASLPIDVPAPTPYGLTSLHISPVWKPNFRLLRSFHFIVIIPQALHVPRKLAFACTPCSGQAGFPRTLSVGTEQTASPGVFRLTCGCFRRTELDKSRDRGQQLDLGCSSACSQLRILPILLFTKHAYCAQPAASLPSQYITPPYYYYIIQQGWNR